MLTDLINQCVQTVSIDDDEGETIELVSMPLSDLILRWMEAQGKTPGETIRGYEVDPAGFTVIHGGNYDWVSADLLGGSSDGVAADTFNQWLTHNQ